MVEKSTYCLSVILKYILIVLLISLLACNEQSQTGQTIEQEKYISPISVQGLQARSYQSELIFVKKLEQTTNYQASLYQYASDDLNIFTLISKPTTPMPEQGYPVLVFGHGFHPEPKKYGISSSTGEEWRPGDYYRDIPAAYAAKGFLVITPDYRGHNTSDGFEFTQKKYISSNFYTIDVLNLLAAMKTLEDANLKQIVYLGHSMGGDVGLRMLLATDQVKAASLWSAVLASTTEQVMYYGHYYDEIEGLVDNNKFKEYAKGLNEGIASLAFDYESAMGDPIYFVDELQVPLMIQHARGDRSVPYAWSESLASKLFELEKPFEFHSYQSNNHLFEEENFNLAVKRDIQFFRKYIN